MEELKQIFQIELEKADCDTLLTVWALRETFERTSYFNRCCNTGIFNGMLNRQYDRLPSVNSLLASLTNDENSQLWEFILDQTKDLRSRIPAEHLENINLFSVGLDKMCDLRGI